MDTALVIIDTQVDLIEPAYRSSEVLENIRLLIDRAHATSTPIVYIQHSNPKGQPLEADTAGWEIHPTIAPRAGDIVVHKKASDSFHNTTLQHELERLGSKQLIVVGGQTEYCVDTTVRRATTFGYNVVLVADAHTTFDSPPWTARDIIAYHNNVLAGFLTDEARILVKPTAEIVL